MADVPDGFAANRRLYAQMRPDDASLAHLLALLGSVSSAGPHGLRPVPRSQLHLTLIHFGKVRDVYRVIRSATGISLAAYEEALEGYIGRTEALLPPASFRLQPVHLSGFGANGRTLVVEYAPTPELSALHAALLAELEDFLAGCGIEDTAGFMAGDPNFMFAPTLRPHITLARGYTGPPPVLPLAPVTLTPMPVVYPGR